MAVLFFNGNSPYVKINSTDVSPLFAKINLQRTGNTTEVTAGSGATDKMRKPGLADTKLKLKLGYKVGSVPDYITQLDALTVITLEYGPEGQLSGKPRHQQDFIITSTPIEQTINADEVAWEIDADAADAPVYNMYAGAVWS